jgi:endonuclease V-like protein UPF0215 family
MNFKKGDSVIVLAGVTLAGHSFSAIVIGSRHDTNGEPVITVRDLDFDCWDVYPNDLQLNND